MFTLGDNKDIDNMKRDILGIGKSFSILCSSIEVWEYGESYMIRLEIGIKGLSQYKVLLKWDSLLTSLLVLKYKKNIELSIKIKNYMEDSSTQMLEVLERRLIESPDMVRTLKKYHRRSKTLYKPKRNVRKFMPASRRRYVKSKSN